MSLPKMKKITSEALRQALQEKKNFELFLVYCVTKLFALAVKFRMLQKNTVCAAIT
jgi:hypothetical protein